MKKIILLLKSHVDTYTKKDGTVVAAHDDNRPIKKGDRVHIKKEYQDEGDDKYTWHAVSDEEKGRVDVVPTDHPMQIKPKYTMQRDWLEHHKG